MTASGIARRTLVVSLALLSGVAIYAQTQTAQKPFKPTVGQEGKDVVWVPTPQALVDKMLDMAKVTKQDYVMDLGSGDGRTVITAAKRGARAVGIEYNPEMVDLSIHNAEAAGVSANATFMKADLFETDFSKATVITMFLLTDINLKLRPKLLDLKPGTRLVSNSFDMGDWTADERATITQNCTSWCTALLWIVPAKVNGTWTLIDTKSQNGSKLALKQQYQTITGTLGSTAITNGRLRGTEISFTAGATRYTGTVTGDTMKGTGGQGWNWTATRTPATR